MDVGMRVTKTVSVTLFPGVILAGDIRNDVYVTLERGEFEKGNKTDGEAAFLGSWNWHRLQCQLNLLQ